MTDKEFNNIKICCLVRIHELEYKGIDDIIITMSGALFYDLLMREDGIKINFINGDRTFLGKEVNIVKSEDKDYWFTVGEKVKFEVSR